MRAARRVTLNASVTRTAQHQVHHDHDRRSGHLRPRYHQPRLVLTDHDPDARPGPPCAGLSRSQGRARSHCSPSRARHQRCRPASSRSAATAPARALERRVMAALLRHRRPTTRLMATTRLLPPRPAEIDTRRSRRQTPVRRSWSRRIGGLRAAAAAVRSQAQAVSRSVARSLASSASMPRRTASRRSRWAASSSTSRSMMPAERLAYEHGPTHAALFGLAAERLPEFRFEAYRKYPSRFGGTACTHGLHPMRVGLSETRGSPPSTVAPTTDDGVPARVVCRCSSVSVRPRAASASLLATC